MTTLYFESSGIVVDDVKKRGFAAVLGAGDLLLSDRSLAAVKLLPGAKGPATELALSISGDVSAYECRPMDVPGVRWYDIPAEELDKLIKKP